MDQDLRQRLINWGYAVTDAAMRHWVTHTDEPKNFPYPNGVG
jgi:NTE family protein